MEEKKSSLLKWALGSVGGGAGVTIAISAVNALKERPEFVPQLLSSGFLGFAALTVGMVMFNRQFQSFNAMQERHVIAQEALAQNVGALVSKNSEEARELELTVNHLARQSDQILDELRRIKAGSTTP